MVRSRLGASGRCAAEPGSGSRFPPYLVLLRVGFTLPPTLPAERCALTAPFHPYRTGRPGLRPSGQLRVPKHEHPAVSFLLHWPSMGFEAHVPDVIRHTALRSSDFPLPAGFACANPSGSDRPVLLPRYSVAQIGIYETNCRDYFGREIAESAIMIQVLWGQNGRFPLP